MRQNIIFPCDGSDCVASIDNASGTTGLLIISGGNEIRSGAHAGQSKMAAHFAHIGYPVFRYDRRGIGDSEGRNAEFISTAPDIASAINAFKRHCPQIKSIAAYGNCDAASAIMLFHQGLDIDHLLLSNPWSIDNNGSNGSNDHNNENKNGETENGKETPTSQPSAAAIRARYWAKLKNPKSLLGLFTGKVNIKKLIGGIAKATKKEAASKLSIDMAKAIEESNTPTHIMIARGDSTALSFMDVWNDNIFAKAKNRNNVHLNIADTASHSFADDAAKAWLYQQIEQALKNR